MGLLTQINLILKINVALHIVKYLVSDYQNRMDEDIKIKKKASYSN